MQHRVIVVSRLLTAIAVLALAALAGAPASSAAGTEWGDLSHFGDQTSELGAPEPAFGVNPEDGSVWVVDHVGAEEELRLQKFEQVGGPGGTWTAVASHIIGSSEAPNKADREVEGVAFDQKEKRAYVLITESRKVKEQEEQVAGELLAFSTVTSGGKIEPASGTKAVTNTNGGVLVPRTETKLTGSPVGKKEFSPNSTEKGTVLFAPGGITVNPTNDQVLITGWVGGLENQEPEVWAISKEGDIKTVWKDETKFFEKCGCLSAPVVTPAGKILVLGDELQEITELPSDLSSATAPKQAFWLPRLVECNERLANKEPPCPFIEKIAKIEDGNEVGGSMALGPEGNLYVHINIRNASEGELQDGAVMVLSPTLQEIGWIGGGSWGSATKACAVNEKDPGNFGPALVGGYKEHVFMFERGDPLAGEHAKVLELGPGGNPANCPQGSSTKPVAEAGGFKLASFPIADKVKLSSELTQANALSTEWEFGDEVTQNVEKRQQNLPVVEHQFKKAGVLKVVERVHSDDLATPTITVSENVTIVAPEVKAEQPTPEGTSATLKAEVNPKGSPTECEFQVVEAGKPFSDPSAKKLACPTKPGEPEKWVPETVKATGLTAGTHYAFRLLAKAGAWESAQPGTEFEIAAAGAPEAQTQPASEIASTSATLNGTVNPKGTKTKACRFEYGTTLPSVTSVPCSTLPEGSAAVAVSAKVTGLAPATTYKFRVVDENINGQKAEGLPVQSFTTAAEPKKPSAEALEPKSLSQTTATLVGLVNPQGATTSCSFEYGTTTSYGTTVPCGATLSGEKAAEVSASVSGLAAGTAYHYRVTASNERGSTPSGDREFKTPAAAVHTPPPTTTTTTTGPPPSGGVLPVITSKFVPLVTVAGSSKTVAANGAFMLMLSCPKEETTCTGTVVVKTLTAVAAKRSAYVAKKKKAILTLASASFSVTAGKLKAVSLRLSAKARRLLAKTHTVRARVTIVAHDPQGATHTTSAILTLRAAKKKH
jgi:hypothetical protein